jgi:hypothetical protein
MHTPVDKDTVEHLPSGYIRLELLHGETVHTLESWLQKSLQDPGAVLCYLKGGICYLSLDVALP